MPALPLRPVALLLLATAALPAAAAPGKPPDQDPAAKERAEIARQRPDPARIDQAAFSPGVRPDRSLLTRVQVLLDRARFHPGVIDGLPGENLDNALKSFKAARGLPDDPTIDERTWQALSADAARPIVDYTVTEKDAKGPFTKSIPAKMELQAKLPRLGYRNAWEELAEKFHTDAAFLRALNPGKNAGKAGTTLKVPDVATPLDPTDVKTAGREIRSAQKESEQAGVTKAARVVVDKPAHLVTAYGADGKVLATYPASIGSTEKPAPSGTLQVVRVAPNPGYTYNPKYAFKGVKAKQTFEIKPGPNNPVGAVWIQLTGEGYGIHGTPEPDRVGKTSSHGCIRLTNWNALELASMVGKDVPVEFKG